MNNLSSQICSSILIFMPCFILPRFSAINEKEDRFCNKYGNNPATSGRWPLIRDPFLAQITDHFPLFCQTIHRKAYPQEHQHLVVISAVFRTAILAFENHESVEVDMLHYTMVDMTERITEPSLNYFITKGEEPTTTVYYLDKVDQEGTTFRLGMHVIFLLPRRQEPVAKFIPSSEIYLDFSDTDFTDDEEDSESLRQRVLEEEEAFADLTEELVTWAQIPDVASSDDKDDPVIKVENQIAMGHFPTLDSNVMQSETIHPAEGVIEQRDTIRHIAEVPGRTVKDERTDAEDPTLDSNVLQSETIHSVEGMAEQGENVDHVVSTVRNGHFAEAVVKTEEIEETAAERNSKS